MEVAWEVETEIVVCMWIFSVTCSFDLDRCLDSEDWFWLNARDAPVDIYFSFHWTTDEKLGSFCLHLDRILSLRTLLGPISDRYNIYIIGIYGDLTETTFNATPLQGWVLEVDFFIIFSAVIKQMCHVSPYWIISLAAAISFPKFSVGDNKIIRVHLIWAGIELCVQDLIISLWLVNGVTLTQGGPSLLFCDPG